MEMMYFSIILVFALHTFTLSQNVCPSPCWRGGKFNTITDTCDCPFGWKNDIDGKCEAKSCPTGTGPTSTNHCENCLQNGWEGHNCDVCMSGEACNQRNSKHNHCLKDLSSYQNMHFSCGIVDYIFSEMFGNSSTFQCRNVGYGSNSTGECFFQLWSYVFMDDKNDLPDGYMAEFMYCDFYDCEYTRTKENEIDYFCGSSFCDCNEGQFGAGEVCSQYKEEIIDNMRGRGGVSCQLDKQFCTFIHSDFGMDVLMKCDSGECVEELVEPPPPPPNYILVTFIFVISISTALCIIIVFIAIVFDLIFRKISKREFTLLSEKKVCGMKLEVTNLNYFINVWQYKKFWFAKEQILNNFSFTFQPGKMYAIMGETGAGKTSLLDVLGSRKKSGKVTGRIRYNDRVIDSTFKRLTGYVFGDDNLISTLTVQECIQFSADLRISTSVSYKKKKEMVEEVMKKLSIFHIAKRRIGDEMKRGISGGERRRVSIACELIVNPHLLILDEVTTGLDSSTAYSLISLLENLAKNEGRTIIFSIHQPRKIIFEKFDELIFLHKGKSVYTGKISDVVPFFEKKLKKKMPQNDNPADWLVDEVLLDAKLLKNEDPEKKNEKESIWKASPGSESESESESVKSESEISESDVESETETESEVDSSGEKRIVIKNKIPYDVFSEKLIRCTTPFLHQLWTLVVKDFKVFIRNFYLMPLHFITAILMGGLLGVLYFQSELNLAGSHNRMGAIFFIMSVLSFTAMSGISVFVGERPVFVRERASGYYYAFSYWLSKIILDIIPLRILPTIILCSIFYFLIGLRSVPVYSFFVFLGLMVLFNVISGLVCIAIGTLSPSVSSANIITTIYMLLSSVFSGFLLNKNSLPWSMYWLSYLSYWSYSYEALIVNEFSGVKVLIDPQNLPSYIVDGKFILDEFGLKMEMFILDFSVLCVFTIFLLVLSGLLVQFCIKEKR